MKRYLKIISLLLAIVMMFSNIAFAAGTSDGDAPPGTDAMPEQAMVSDVVVDLGANPDDKPTYTGNNNITTTVRVEEKTPEQIAHEEIIIV